MARKSTATSVDKVIGDRQFEALMKNRLNTKAEISSLSGLMGEREKAAAEDANLHGGAFKAVARLVKMDELKREDFLRSFTIYVEKSRRLGLMGEEHAGDLADLAEDEGGEPGDQGEGEPTKLSDAARTAFGENFKELKSKKGKGGGGGLEGGDAPGGTRIQ